MYIGRGLTIRLWATGSLSEMLRVGHGRLAGNVHRGGTQSGLQTHARDIALGFVVLARLYTPSKGQRYFFDKMGSSCLKRI